ncbi:MAG TPA: cupin domain-containing protein [Parvularculaceae bacterium]|nr:cupin domain-containing protein [Parvularculaceae bacterium]HNS85980.1 cupin domain-containing protein [Parvularculaceae bacterium]
MPKIDIDATPVLTGTGYPPPYDAAVRGRSRKRIGDAGGLTQYGVNLLTLAPGAASAHRHWHANEDEFVYVLSGEVMLIEDDGETSLKAGEAAAFPAGAEKGHHLVNRSTSPAVLLEVGTRAATEDVRYTDPDVDMRAVKTESGWRFLRKNETP